MPNDPSWTVEQDAELLKLRDVSRWSFRKIGARFGTTNGATYNRYQVLVGRIAKQAPPKKRAPSLHVQLGIKTTVYRVPILGADRWGFNDVDPVTGVGTNDHRFRASVTLAAV